MKAKISYKLLFVIVLSSLLLSVSLLIITQAPSRAAGKSTSIESSSTTNTAIVTSTITNVTSLLCDDPNLTQPITPTGQTYSEAVPLLEQLGASTTELQSAYVGTPNALEKSLDEFSILKEGDTYYLWIASRLKTGPSSLINTIEQRLESKNGLVWCNRTNTNLARTDIYKYSLGPRTIIKNGGLYEGWDEYYYEWSVGWGYAVRYITSTNGITWTVANEPALIGTENSTVIKEGNIYRMWADPHGDNSYKGSRSLRYRTSINGGTGWGDWQTGGMLVSLDGQETGNGFSRVRRLADGTHQLFYFQNNSIHLATSTNGITFTTQISNFLNLTQILPITNVNPLLWDFAVVDIGGEDWVYLSYCKTMSVIGRCIDSHMAVARPIYTATLPTYTYLPVIISKWPPIAFPIHIGNAILKRPVNPKGETFYSQTVQVPNQLPSSGHFYFSSRPDTVTQVLVDDELVILSNKVQVFAYDFSTSGSPKAAIIELSRALMQQLAGKTVTIQYRDLYGVVIQATDMWLIWVP